MQIDSVVVGTTNIRIDLKTKDKLSALGKHGDSFNSIIEELMREHYILASLAPGYPGEIAKIHNFYYRK